MPIRYITQEALAQVPSLANLVEEARDQALADATIVYDLINDAPWLTEDSLRVAAAAAGLDADRTNLALAVLVETNRIASVSVSLPAGTESTLGTDLTDMPKAMLNKIAKEKGIEGYTKMDRDELLTALQSS